MLPNAGELILAPGEGICPKAASGGCYTVEVAIAIAESLRYARKAWIKCRPKPSAAPAP